MQNIDSGRNRTNMGDGQDRDGMNRDGMGESASEIASTAQEKISEGASAAQEKFGAGAEAVRENAASGLASAANRMRDQSSGQDGMQAQVKGKAADAMENASHYLAEHDSQELWTDLERFVKDHPMQAAAGALVAGYVLAKVTR
jgi:ElaB/YqjD/DUF883 family membrane-anchored ribosome-binding protein